MRLHRLRLRALGPFVDEQVVDFEELSAGGLFLLDGPTGAGKSSVLDAITFALYGAGDRGGDGRLVSHFAGADAVPEVELEFSVRGVRQRVTRRPAFERPKRRGDGTTTEKAWVHLQRWTGSAWQSRSARNDEVGDLLADDIGLTRVQFSQVVLLPQGQFMSFLQAGDDERRLLLTRLFGTRLYDRITDELERRRVDATHEVDAAQRRVHARVARAGEAAGLAPTACDELSSLGDAARDRELDELAAQLAAEAAITRTAAEGALLTRASRRLAVTEADSLAARCARLVRIHAALAVHEQSRADTDGIADALLAAARAEPVRPLLAALGASADAVAQASAGALRLGVDPVPGDATAAAEAVAVEVARGVRCTVEVAALEHLVDLETGLPAARLEVAHAAEAAAEASDALAKVEARRTRLPAEIDAVAERLRTAGLGAARIVERQAQHDLLEARRVSATGLLAVTAQLAVVERDERAAVDAHQSATDEFHRVQERRLAGIAAELASQLHPGEPCTVCGAAEHPSPARPAGEPVRPADVTRARSRRDAAETARREAEAALARVRSSAAELRIRADGLSVAELTASLARCAEELRNAIADERTLPGLRVSRDALAAERIDLDSSHAEWVRSLADARARLDSAQRGVAELAERIGAAAADRSSVRARRDALARDAADAAAAAEVLRAVQAGLSRHADAAAQAAHEALARGFDSVAQAEAAALPAAEFRRLRAELDDWRRADDGLLGELGAPDLVGLDPADQPRLRDALSAAKTQLADAETDADAAVRAAERAAVASTRFADARRDVAAAVAGHARLCADAEPVVHLAKLARGMAGQRRVALTTYVLRQWFEQVVAAANVRLAGMSSGRYELLRVDESASRAERVGLTLQVLDRHTGEQRGTRSLSGGETFYTSLALALGLADVVRAEAGGVDLDTLFIDEGFGSLDADTLDQVMDVIDELRERGRTVGIVSHVAELKDRITERIEVRRLPDGSSALRVVA